MTAGPKENGFVYFCGFTAGESPGFLQSRTASAWYFSVDARRLPEEIFLLGCAQSIIGHHPSTIRFTASPSDREPVPWSFGNGASPKPRMICAQTFIFD